MTSATAHAHEYEQLSDAALARALNHARDVAHAQRKTMTYQREAVYRLLLIAGRPMGAYDLMAQLGAASEKQIAPPTVYRALEFLQELGLVSRIESSNEFLPCSHPGQPHDCMFLVCACCGIAKEIDGSTLSQTVEKIAKAHGFTPERQVVEIRGRCSQCHAHGVD